MSEPISVEDVQSFGVPILKALGLDASSVIGFDIRCEAGDFVTISVKRTIARGSGEAAACTLEKYRLVSMDSVGLADLDESVSLDSLTRMTHRVVGSPAPDRT